MYTTSLVSNPETTGKIVLHKIEFEDLFEDITGETRKVNITFHYYLINGEMFVTERTLTKTEPFVMSDEELRISYDACVDPIVYGYDVSYSSKIEIK